MSDEPELFVQMAAAEGSTATANPSGMMTTYTVVGKSPNPPPVLTDGDTLITICSACGVYRCEGIPEVPNCPNCNAPFPYFEPPKGA